MGVVGAWTLHELVEVVGLALLGLLARVIVHSDQSRVGRSAPILLVLFAPLRGGALVLVLALGLALVLASTKDCSTTSSSEAWFVVTSSRSWVVRGFRQPSLWTKDSQVVPERNALTTSTSMTSSRELHSLDNLRI